MYDDTYHADQSICRNLTKITPSSVLGALRRANRDRRVIYLDIWLHCHNIRHLGVSIDQIRATVMQGRGC